MLETIYKYFKYSLALADILGPDFWTWKTLINPFAPLRLALFVAYCLSFFIDLAVVLLGFILVPIAFGIGLFLHHVVGITINDRPNLTLTIALGFLFAGIGYATLVISLGTRLLLIDALKVIVAPWDHFIKPAIRSFHFRSYEDVIKAVIGLLFAITAIVLTGVFLVSIITPGAFFIGQWLGFSALGSLLPFITQWLVAPAIAFTVCQRFTMWGQFASFDNLVSMTIDRLRLNTINLIPRHARPAILTRFFRCYGIYNLIEHLPRMYEKDRLEYLKEQADFINREADFKSFLHLASLLPEKDRWKYVQKQAGSINYKADFKSFLYLSSLLPEEDRFEFFNLFHQNLRLGILRFSEMKPLLSKSDDYNRLLNGGNDTPNNQVQFFHIWKIIGISDRLNYVDALLISNITDVLSTNRDIEHLEYLPLLTVLEPIDQLSLAFKIINLLKDPRWNRISYSKERWRDQEFLPQLTTILQENFSHTKPTDKKFYSPHYGFEERQLTLDGFTQWIEAAQQQNTKSALLRVLPTFVRGGSHGAAGIPNLNEIIVGYMGPLPEEKAKFEEKSYPAP